MLKKRKLIKKLFDDVSVINWNTIFSINKWEYKFEIPLDEYYEKPQCKTMWDLLDLALFCSQWWEDFDEFILSAWEYEERFKLIFNWWVGSNLYYVMNVDCIFEKSLDYNEKINVNNTEIFTGFYYIDTLDLVINILELLDRSYKEQKKNNNSDSKNEYYHKYDKSIEEIAEKKCTIIKNLWFWYHNQKKFKDIPRYINNLEPIVDLHANDEWKYPHIWTNFCLIWDWKGVDIEI